MQKYPYLAKYTSGSEYQDVVVWMLEPHRGLVVYIPVLSQGDPRGELSMFESMTPANSEIEIYEGSIILHGDADPELDE